MMRTRRTPARRTPAALAAVLAVLLMWTMGGTAAAAPVTPDLPTLNVRIDDPDPTHTVGWLAQSKDNVALARFSVEDPSGLYDMAEQDSSVPATGQIKTRGNYTFTLAKKPYQIKLPAAAALLGMAPASTWVLLANHADASLMRNKVAFDLAASIGMPFSSESRWVDLRVNGVPRGNYLVTEKVEAKTNRVQLTKDGPGVIAELDNNYGTAEDYYFYTTASKTLFTLKDAMSGVPDKAVAPLPAATQAGWDDMRATLDRLDSLLAASTPDWTAIGALIDVDSFVRYYFVNELTENPEITSSSIYFYKDGIGTADKLHAGPVWDYDSALGNYDKSEWLGAFTESSYTKNAQILRSRGNGWFFQLYRNPQFVQRVNQMWTSAGIAYQVSRLPSRIDGYATQIRASAANNFALWRILGTPTLLIAGQGRTYATTYSGEVSYLRSWVTRRFDHLQKEYGTVPTARYQGHVQNLGWQPFVDGGQISGTVGKALRLEAVNLSLLNSTGVTGSVTGNAHVQNLGWSGYKSTSLLGTTGRSLRLEAVQLKLTGNLALKYDIQYRAHVQNIGWMPWVQNGLTAGTTGQAKRMEAVQIRLLHKVAPAPVPTP